MLLLLLFLLLFSFLLYCPSYDDDNDIGFLEEDDDDRLLSLLSLLLLLYPLWQYPFVTRPCSSIPTAVCPCKGILIIKVSNNEFLLVAKDYVHSMVTRDHYTCTFLQSYLSLN